MSTTLDRLTHTQHKTLNERNHCSRYEICWVLGPMNFYILYNVDIYLGKCYLVTTIKIKTNQTKQTYTPNKEGCLLKNKNKKF